MSEIQAAVDLILECDKLKAVLRRTRPAGLERAENSGEHSWSAALFAMALFPHAPEGIDRLKVLEMLLVHDVVEIDAGDTFFYDDRPEKEAEELKAAERIFAMLPGPEGERMLARWIEFEAGESPEAAFAKALDRLLPMVQNVAGGGRSWRENGVTLEMALSKNSMIKKGSESLWNYAKEMLENAGKKGMFGAE